MFVLLSTAKRFDAWVSNFHASIFILNRSIREDHIRRTKVIRDQSTNIWNQNVVEPLHIVKFGELGKTIK